MSAYTPNTMHNVNEDTPLIIKITENPRLKTLRLLATFDPFLKSFSVITAQYQGSDMCCTSKSDWTTLKREVTKHIGQCLDEMRTNKYQLLVSQDISKRIAKSARAAGLDPFDAWDELRCVRRASCVVEE